MLSRNSRMMTAPIRCAGIRQEISIQRPIEARMDPEEDQLFEVARRQLLLARGFDLSGYSRSFVLRAIKKRIARTKSRDFPAYTSLLRRDDAEVGELVSALSINVTDFFRDKGAFEAFSAKVIRPMLVAKNTPIGGIIRIWSAGCATGQEPYTLAICLEEAVRCIEGENRTIASVLGTDISQPAIDAARKGVYSLEQVKGVPERFLREYFAKTDEGYEVSEALRRRVRFSRNNLLSSPVSTHFDAVVCRNVVIYFARPMHDRVLMTLHGSLRVGGYLMIGRTETLMGLPRDMFESVDADNRIYRKIA